MLELLKKYLFLVVIGIVIIAFLFFTNDDGPENNSEFASDMVNKNMQDTPQQTKSATAIVDVKGEVAKPGVYEINMDSRVNDVIHLAGGFLKDADQTMVNLAQKVQDEMVIIIPKIGASTTDNEGSSQKGSSKIRINYASQAEIETLNGIGPSKASAIIQYREENGYFKKVDDLLNVSGIGEKTLENMKEAIQIP